MKPQIPIACVLMGVGLFVLAALAGPFFSHPDYSSISHTTSELAGQNMPGAWIMRTGFIGFGAGTLAASALVFRRIPDVAAALMLFGLAMIVAAFWSNMPIDPALGGTAADDRLHSIAATGMGFAFAAAAALRLWRHRFALSQWPAWGALAASILLPLGMVAFPMIDGALQRAMFVISFFWIAHEIRDASSPEDTGLRAS
jgi:Protein of unknown function (DUF998)